MKVKVCSVKADSQQARTLSACESFPSASRASTASSAYSCLLAPCKVGGRACSQASALARSHSIRDHGRWNGAAVPPRAPLPPPLLPRCLLPGADSRCGTHGHCEVRLHPPPPCIATPACGLGPPHLSFLIWQQHAFYPRLRLPSLLR